MLVNNTFCGPTKRLTRGWYYSAAITQEQSHLEKETTFGLAKGV